MLRKVLIFGYYFHHQHHTHAGKDDVLKTTFDLISFEELSTCHITNKINPFTTGKTTLCLYRFEPTEDITNISSAEETFL